MLHPILEVNDLNVILLVSSFYALLVGFVSLKIKQKWYLGEAYMEGPRPFRLNSCSYNIPISVPAFVVGVVLGPSAANLVRIPHPGGKESENSTSEITYALTRLVIGIQLVKVGYELPKKYLKRRLKEMTICLLPLMAVGWIATSVCIILMVPHISFLAALIIGSCVTCTDPILSQAIAKGPFADNYVRRHLREFISSEAGGNDGFGFPFLLLGVSLLRYAETPTNTIVLEEFDLARGGPDLLGSMDVGRFGGGVGKALKHWFVEGFLYMVVLGTAYGVVVGFVCRKVLIVTSRKQWIDPGCFTLVPAVLGMFIVGSCGCFGSDETLACFIAGSILNWDGLFHAELQLRHDSFNSSLEILLNYVTFGYLGAVMPWEEFQMPESTGITAPQLLGLGVLILIFRRIPAIMVGYRFMPEVCSNWKEALFMGHFGPIGVGAIAYVEYARRLFPDRGQSDNEINSLTAAMRPVVYWLVLFSVIVHGLSVPILYLLYQVLKVPKVCDHPVEVILLSENEPLPNNSTVDRQRHSVMINNRFSEPNGFHASAQEEKDEDESRSSSDRMRPQNERSSASYSLDTSLSNQSTQRLSREADTRDIV
ncbi:Sodium/hydrogen exchanger family-domain-containing protein [Aspergillus karnatakaensis]|uniref:putative plasma membrane antiporter n=1 Tax=Aspergillus karnatakaensis TaxID=1810916 RepID=UPI003CCCF797